MKEFAQLYAFVFVLYRLTNSTKKLQTNATNETIIVIISKMKLIPMSNDTSIVSLFTMKICKDVQIVPLAL